MSRHNVNKISYNNNIKLNVEQEEDLDDYLSSVDSNDKLEDIIDYCKNINKDYELA